MQVKLLKAKIHRAEVTDRNLDYEGSLGVDTGFLEKVGMLPYERILVGNINNGKRFETYIIPAPRGSRAIVLNGAAAHLGKVGDVVAKGCSVSLPQSHWVHACTYQAYSRPCGRMYDLVAQPSDKTHSKWQVRRPS